MMHEREKSDPAIGAGKPTNKAEARAHAEHGGSDASGAGGAKGGGEGERGRAKHAPDPGSGARVTGARSRTESCKAEEGREVHRAPTPHQPRPASGSVLRAQTRCRPRGGWGDVADLRGGP